MIKAVFFDVDGTLVSFQTHTVPPSALKALHTLHEKGVLVFLATGRHLSMLDPLRALFPFDGFITLSGQYCLAGGEVLRSCPMSHEAASELVEAAGSNAFSCIFLEGEEIYLNCVNDLTLRFIDDLSIPLPPVRDVRHALEAPLYQAVTFLDKDHEHLLLSRAPHVKTTRWHPNFLDVIPQDGGKDKGMDALLSRFGIAPMECMAFGDGENDESMLIHAGIGVAMGSASHQVKSSADYAAPTVDQDGVAVALSHFGLI